MLFYIVIFFLLFFLAVYFKKNLLVLILSSITLITIASFRGLTIGTDTHNYYYYYLHSEYSLGYMELLWSYLNYFIYNLGFNFNGFLFIIHSIIVFTIVYIAWKEVENPQLVLFFYYAIYAYCNSFNGLRQYLAVSIVLLAFYFLKNKQNLKYLITVFVASLIHHSAILAFLPLLFLKINIKMIHVFLLLVISFIIGTTFFQNLNLDFLLGKYINYSQKDNFFRDSEQALILCIIMNMYFFIFSFTSPKKILENIYYKCFLTGMLLMNLTVKLTLGTRVILYFTIVQIILIPIYFQEINAGGINKKIIQTCLLIYFTTIFFKILILGNGELYPIYPYYITIYSNI